MCSAGQLVPIKYVDNPDTDASITKKEQIICKNLDENSDCPKSTKNVPGCYMDEVKHREWKYITRPICSVEEEKYFFGKKDCVKDKFKIKGECKSVSDQLHAKCPV